jgi:hypothetical protein
MIKGLLFTVALLAPGLACGANPSGDLSVEVVPAGSVAVVPAAAQAAGFTTLAANYDFTQPLPSKWIACSGDNSAGHWFWQWWNIVGTSPPCNTINQVFDSVASSNVLDIEYPAANGAGGQQLKTTSQDGSQVVSYPTNAYYEIVYRTVTTPSVPAPQYEVPGHASFWVYPVGSPTGFEMDFQEAWFMWQDSWDANLIDHSGGGRGGWVYNRNSPGTGYDFTQYHTIGWRTTGDGSSTLAACSYLDGIQLNCISTFYGAPFEQTQRQALILWLASACTGASAVGNASCMNVPITSVYNCAAPNAGKTCVTLAHAADQPQCGTPYNAVISGVSGVAGVNGVQPVCSVSGKPTDTDFILKNTTWPGGSYSGGGTWNFYTRMDMYVKTVRVWSCADWKTTACNGQVLTGTP